jgi:hypothetical protein
MRTVRKALRLAVSSWIVLQLAGLAAAPIVFCSRATAPESDSHGACCPGVGPGQVCPMHKTREGASKCALSSGCHTSDIALVSLFASIGLTPQSSFTVHPGVSSDRIARLTERSIARASLPEAPPPRI